MDPALEALLDGVIDYAGLYPPARLDMEPAVREYFRHLGGPDSLIVNRFVCPASRLAELGDVLDKFHPDVIFAITATGAGTEQIDADRAALDAHAKRFGSHFEVEAFETKSIGDVQASLRALKPLAHLDLYLEVPLDDHIEESLHAIADAEFASAKARTGGQEPAAFPPSARLANFMRECLDLNLAFKLTAGLHHPIRRLDPTTGATAHGFLNVLIALALAEEHELNRAEITAILEDENAHNFIVDGNEAGHGDLRAGLQSIDAVRTLFSGFGSCSLEEPVEDLKALGLW